MASIVSARLVNCYSLVSLFGPHKKIWAPQSNGSNWAQQQAK